ncbi:MAG: response regulator transcription factor [Anaerolineaceae bacterium]|nr:response regulator transcription factor [Anaerolineaceae bacterium]
MTLPPIRILLVDHHEMARRGLANHISTHEDMQVVGLAANGDETLELCGKTMPDVVVIDLDLAGMDSIAVTAAITRSYPGVQVIVITLFMDEIKHQEALAAGAFRYLLKGNPIDELLRAIRDAQSPQKSDHIGAN